MNTTTSDKDSGARNYARDYVIHAHAPSLGVSCGRIRARDYICSSNRADVTCKRCLASLAKQDREFRAKARSQFAHTSPPALDPRYRVGGPLPCFDAARAIAREEGR